MPKSYSDNAVMAKVRALYGKRLSTEDYNQLLQKRSVMEIASYLKKETYFADSMQEVKEDMIHRGQLENIIRRHNLDIYIRLMKYSYNDDLFLKMYVMKNEISQLLLAIRLLNAGSMDRYIVSFPAYFSKHMSLDLFKIAACKTFDDLLETLRRTEYYALIGRFRPLTSERSVDITGCETALLTYYYEKLLDMIETGYSGDTRASLKQLLYYQIDLHNISVIFRMKRFFHSPPNAIRACLVKIKAKLGLRVYDALIQIQDVREFNTILGHIRASQLFPLDISRGTEHVSSQIFRVKRYLNQRVFRFSIRPVVVVMSFMTLLDIEENNLTNVIEGARYNIPADEVRSLLAL